MNRPAVQAIQIALSFLFGITKNRERLPEEQCLLVANHNSSLDTYALASLLSWHHKGRMRVAAAKDTFAAGLAGWFARHTLDILLVERHPRAGQDPLAEIKDLLRQGSSLALYPEGTRGQPGELGRFKRGVGVLAVELPDLPVYAVYIRGIEKCLGRNEWLVVPFQIGLTVADAPLYGRASLEACGNRTREASRHFTLVIENTVRRLGGHAEVVASAEP